MDVVIRKDENNNWGFLESFSKYRTIHTGNIKVLVGVTPQGTLSTPYVLRNNEFIPLSVIDSEMGIDKYIKAKKPFYSMLSEGFIAFIKAGINYTEGEFLPDKTVFDIYRTSGKTIETPTTGVLHLAKVYDIPENVEELLMSVARKVVECNGDREEFLRSRL